MTKKRSTITDPDLAQVGKALRRAAAKALQIGMATNTPVYVFRDGKIIDLVKENRTPSTTKKPRRNPSPRQRQKQTGKSLTKKR